MKGLGILRVKITKKNFILTIFFLRSKFSDLKQMSIFKKRSCYINHLRSDRHIFYFSKSEHSSSNNKNQFFYFFFGFNY